MHFLITIRPALTLLAIVSRVSAFNINLLLNIFDEAPPLVQAAFGLKFRRATTTSIVTQAPVTQAPPSMVTPDGGTSVVGGGTTVFGGTTAVNPGTTVVVVQSPPVSSLFSNIWTNPSGSPVPTPGCAAGSISFNGMPFPNVQIQ
jgi:hypothetical protein